MALRLFVHVGLVAAFTILWGAKAPTLSHADQYFQPIQWGKGKKPKAKTKNKKPTTRKAKTKSPTKKGTKSKPAARGKVSGKSKPAAPPRRRARATAPKPPRLARPRKALGVPPVPQRNLADAPTLQRPNAQRKAAPPRPPRSLTPSKAVQTPPGAAHKAPPQVRALPGKKQTQPTQKPQDPGAARRPPQPRLPAPVYEELRKPPPGARPSKLIKLPKGARPPRGSRVISEPKPRNVVEAPPNLRKPPQTKPKLIKLKGNQVSIPKSLQETIQKGIRLLEAKKYKATLLWLTPPDLLQRMRPALPRVLAAFKRGHANYLLKTLRTLLSKKPLQDGKICAFRVKPPTPQLPPYMRFVQRGSRWYLMSR
ncbi:MAG: hypothetical protein EP343_04210 [Deltaproteobacteria bacterium]|nr:MAG: hypothetical protein EP343_04210 [Deltaproteobacteria bacterium]